MLYSFAHPTLLDEIRGTVWKLLLSYLPTSSERRDTTLARKRSEYTQLVQSNQFFSDEALLHQVKIDVADNPIIARYGYNFVSTVITF